MALAAVALAAGCSPSGSAGGASDCAVGSEGCPCTAGGACDPGLTCLSDLCVDPGGDGIVTPPPDASTIADTPRAPADVPAAVPDVPAAGPDVPVAGPDVPTDVPEPKPDTATIDPGVTPEPMVGACTQSEWQAQFDLNVAEGMEDIGGAVSKECLDDTPIGTSIAKNAKTLVWPETPPSIQVESGGGTLLAVEGLECRPLFPGKLWSWTKKEWSCEQKFQCGCCVLEFGRFGAGQEWYVDAPNAASMCLELYHGMTYKLAPSGSGGDGKACVADWQCGKLEYCATGIGKCVSDPCKTCLDTCKGLPSCCCGVGCQCSGPCANCQFN